MCSAGGRERERERVFEISWKSSWDEKAIDVMWRACWRQMGPHVLSLYAQSPRSVLIFEYTWKDLVSNFPGGQGRILSNIYLAAFPSVQIRKNTFFSPILLFHRKHSQKLYLCSQTVTTVFKSISYLLLKTVSLPWIENSIWEQENVK